MYFWTDSNIYLFEYLIVFFNIFEMLANLEKFFQKKRKLYYYI